MPITATQIETRKKHIGSSDMAKILGLDPRHNAYDVWLEKTGRLEETGSNEAMYAGNMFEDGILQHAERQLGKIIRNQYRSMKDQGIPLGANIDALLVESGLPIEVKTAGLYGPLTEQWGDPGTDQVPDRVIIQVHVHMACTAQELCHVAAFLGGRGFQMFAVPRDAEIAEIIVNKAGEFWTNHVEKDIPPENLLPSAAFIKRVRREPQSVIPVEQNLIDSWLVAKDVLKQAKQHEEQAQTAILTALGDSEAGECESGMFTFLQQTRAAYQVKESTYRVARFKKRKEMK